MKRKFFTFLLLAFTYLTAAPSVFAQEKIKEFKSDVAINLDGSINVTETIIYDFDELKKHGIFRIIPTIKTNEEGKKFQLDFQVLEVQDKTGEPYPYKILKDGVNLKIKIGDPEKTITGIHTYVISYKVSGALTYFSDHDELYWNASGNEWQIPIDKTTVTVSLPPTIKEGVKLICFTGKFSSKEQACQWEKLSFASYRIWSTRNLNPYEGLTFAVSFPKGIVAVLKPQEYGKLTSGQALLLGVAFLLGLFWYLIAPLVLLFLWFKYGRDPKVGKPVSAWYDPPQDKTGRLLTPAEMGALVDEKADNRDLTATIVSLAIGGYLKIRQENKNYLFIKRKEFLSDSRLTSHEILILKKLFKDKEKVSRKDLEDDFYQTFEKFSEDLYKKLVSLGFFPENPQSVRRKYFLLSIFALMTLNIPLVILASIISNFMPRKTIAGAKAKIKALGLKNFLVSQERQLEFQVKNWFMFEKLLSYAIVFGVEKIWAERFRDLVVRPPDWYESDWGSSFNTVDFTNSIGRSISALDTLSAPPITTSVRSSSGFSSGFSGGGSSGGGGGGGGGGSW